MSENRDPVEILIQKLPNSDGKKKGCRVALKIELFPAHYWAANWFPGSKAWFPKLSIKAESRNEYFETRFRLRINGVWYSPFAKYTTVTKADAIDLLWNIEE